jgi:hypothetical protein
MRRQRKKTCAQINWLDETRKFFFMEEKKMLRIFVRHCLFSEASAHKSRPEDFQRKKLHEQLLHSLIGVKCSLTMLVDKNGKEEKHFIELDEYKNTNEDPGKVDYSYFFLDAGCEAKSFLQTLDFLDKQSKDPFTVFAPTDIIVLLEDDYAVQPGWTNLICEGIHFADYVTLYDHPDKYQLEMYRGLQSKVFKGQERHWRTTPSTTNSFAVRLKTLLEDASIQKEFSTDVQITRDHAKFLRLWALGRTLVSCLPGAWSHEETNMQDFKVYLGKLPEKKVSEESEKPVMTYFS